MKRQIKLKAMMLSAILMILMIPTGIYANESDSQEPIQLDNFKQEMCRIADEVSEIASSKGEGADWNFSGEGVEIQEDVTVHKMVPYPPINESTKGTSPPSSLYDITWNGPYYFSCTAPINSTFYTNYAVYGKTNYTLSITNRQPYTMVVSALIYGYLPRLGITYGYGGLTVPGQTTLTLQFNVASSETRVYVASSSINSSVDITGILY